MSLNQDGSPTFDSTVLIIHTYLAKSLAQF